MSNDKQIEDLRKKIKDKKESLGKPPVASYLTNGVIKINEQVHNINVLTEEGARDLLGHLLLKNLARELVADELEEDFTASEDLDNTIADLKTRLTILVYKTEKKKLDAMDLKLTELLSEKAKTKNAIEDISKELNL